MMDWKQSLAGVDEDYLVGISNKGIVKRAYKDLGENGGSAGTDLSRLDWSAQELVVAAGGETVTIRLPLGESGCSCPSRSICRHVIMGILLAKQAAAGGEGDASGTGADHTGENCSENAGKTGPEAGAASAGIGKAGEGIAENVGKTGSESDAASAGNGKAGEGIAGKTGSESDAASAGREETGEGAADASDGTGPGAAAANVGGKAGREGSAGEGTENESGPEKHKMSGESLGDQVWQEVLAQPRKPLLRALGNKGLRRMVSSMEAGELPQMNRSSVVRVQLPGQEMTVKLLSPLSYSTCSCHKKELCSHKAEAILWCQYLGKQLKAEELAAELEQEPDLDLRQLQETAKQVRSCLEGLLEVGLARGGQERVEELERLAILCHNAGLPGWEGDLRALADGYGKYMRRLAGLTMEKLAGQLQQLYDKTLCLERLSGTALEGAAETVQGTVSRIQALAGEFRSTYLPVGELELTGITVEHFVSDSGYEGDTVYFLAISTGTWYTYTSARPTFYDGKKRGGYQEKIQAPWGVPLPLEGLAKVRLRLHGAKCDASGRLSSSQETRGEILGRSELTADKLAGWYYREYDRLFAEQIQPPKIRQAEAADYGHPRLVFVQAERFQQGQFNEITQKLELPVWDPAGRQVLVELPYSKRDEASIRYLERLKGKQKPCFLGRVYLRGSRICLYPVDLLERQELEGTDAGIAAWLQEKKGKISGKSQETAGGRGDDEEPAFQALQSYLEEVSWLLQEVYQVGSTTAQDSTLEALQRAAAQGRDYGMTTLSEWMQRLGEQLSLARHRMKHGSAETLETYCRLWQYVELCRRKTAYDLACLAYCGADQTD